MTPEELEALKELLNCTWEDEQSDYAGYVNDGYTMPHIFTSLVVLQNLIRRLDGMPECKAADYLYINGSKHE